MSKAAMLFNGIRYSFELVDRAFSWANSSKGQLVAIFLRAESDVGEGYLFPSDLDAAENLHTTEEATAGQTAIVDSNIRMLEHAAVNSHIALHTLLLVNPKPEQLLKELEGSEHIFTSEDIYETGTLTVDSINLKKLLQESPAPVEFINSRP